MTTAWIQTGGGKWHVWPTGGRRSICGRLNVEHLRARPAKSITATPPDASADVCADCARKAHRPRPVHPEEQIEAWMGIIRRHLLRVRVRVADVTVAELARRLAEIGSPETAEAREVFEQVRVLLLRPTATRVRGAKKTMTISTIPYLKEALAKLPAHAGALTEVAAAMRCWRAITQRDPTADRFRPDRVIETMFQVPVLEPYIRHLNAKGLPHLASMFHPNTLARAKRDTALRGLFTGSNTYWDATAEQLNIVRD